MPTNINKKKVVHYILYKLTTQCTTISFAIGIGSKRSNTAMNTVVSLDVLLLSQLLTNDLLLFKL